MLAARIRPRGAETAFLGLGGNVGDRFHYLQRAVDLLDADRRTQVRAVSCVYETEAVTAEGDEQSQPPYYNLAVRVTTTRSPLALLDLCAQVEGRLGRVRGTRWGPRTIDVDVLLYGDRVLRGRRLVVPHPRLLERAFALVPLTEVAPGWHLPDGRSLASAVAALVPLQGIDIVGRQVRAPDDPLPTAPPP